MGFSCVSRKIYFDVLIGHVGNSTWSILDDGNIEANVFLWKVFFVFPWLYCFSLNECDLIRLQANSFALMRTSVYDGSVG